MPLPPRPCIAKYVCWCLPLFCVGSLYEAPGYVGLAMLVMAARSPVLSAMRNLRQPACTDAWFCKPACLVLCTASGAAAPGAYLAYEPLCSPTVLVIGGGIPITC